jgi:hypothetical protein
MSKNTKCFDDFDVYFNQLRYGNFDLEMSNEEIKNLLLSINADLSDPELEKIPIGKNFSKYSDYVIFYKN